MKYIPSTSLLDGPVPCLGSTGVTTIQANATSEMAMSGTKKGNSKMIAMRFIQLRYTECPQPA